jgi:hypothetical protein
MEKNLRTTLKKLVLMSCLSLSFLYSCHDYGVSPDNHTNYFPLQLGNEWRFEYPYWTPWSGDTTARVYSKLVASKNVNGKEYFAFDKDLPFFPYHPFVKRLIGGDLNTIFIRQSERGDIMLLVDDSEWLYFTFNASLLDSLVRTKIRDADYFFKIESFDDTVNTPIGPFDKCCRVLNYFPAIVGTEHYIWFAPGYGPVKIYYPELDVTYRLVRINIHNN